MPTKSQFDAAGYLRKRYADHLSQGLCRWCDEPICADSICMCDYHLRLHRKAARKRYWKGKLGEVFEDRINAGDWRVESVPDADGAIDVAIFSGHKAREMAEFFATKWYGWQKP